MSQLTDSATPLESLRARIDGIDARIHAALSERANAEANLAAAAQDAGQGTDQSAGRMHTHYQPDRDADAMRQMVERHDGKLSLVSLEHLWRAMICASKSLDAETCIHLDGGADLIEMLDLARFYFGFEVELVPGTDAADVVGAVSASQNDLGLVMLTDRAELPWWRGLSETGALVRARLPFVVLDERPADLPALVLAKADSLVDNDDVAVYDARWSDVLPGRLMDLGIEVLSFHRSAGGVDALLALSADLPEDEIRNACAAAGAQPDILRRVGGYATPIDGDGENDEDGFGMDDGETRV